MGMMPPATAALTTAAMMVAMMLPSIAPSLWRYHHHLLTMRMSRAAQRTTLFAVGYASVWTTIGLALSAISAALSPMGTVSPTDLPVAPWAPGAVVLCVGAVQGSRWKAKQLWRCRNANRSERTFPRTVMTALMDGGRLGVDCALSCAAPMAILCVTGVMDARIMVLITVAITAERLAPAGVRIARLTGVVALVAGLVICVRAIELTMSSAVHAGSGRAARDQPLHTRHRG